MITPETWIPPSGSQLQSGETCPASMVLERIGEEGGEAAELGTGIHSFIETVVGLLFGPHHAPGIDLDGARAAALALIAEPLRERCEALDLEALELRPDSLHEVGFSLDTDADVVTYHGPGQAHGTIERKPGVISGVFDRVTDRPELDRVDVDDWKTGFLPVPVKGNLQLILGAVCAARHFGRSGARVRIVKLPEDGMPRAEVAGLDTFDLGLGLLRLQGLVAAGREQVRNLRAGEPLRYTQGKDCRYCKSFNFCLPSMRAIKVMATEPLNIDAEITALISSGTDEDAAAAFLAFERWDSLAKRIRLALMMRARNRPILLPDGTEYGEREYRKTKLDGERVYAEIAAAHGAEVAALAVSKKATKKGIRASAKLIVEGKKKAGEKAKIGATETGLHEMLTAKGATVTEIRRKIDRHKAGEIATDDDDE